MYNNDLIFSNQFNYSFDLIPEDLGFFEMKKIIQSKVDELSQTHLVLVEGNKILTIEFDESSKYCLLYEKAQFFIKLFKKTQQFVLINENDDFFYGYINNFPCLFDSNFENAKRVMQEYADGELVQVLGVGVLQRRCHKHLSYDEIVSLKDIEHYEKVDYLSEDSFLYDAEKPDFDNLIMNYLLQNNVIDYKSFVIRNCIMLSCSFLLIACKLF